MMKKRKIIKKHFINKKELLEFYINNKDDIKIYKLTEITPTDITITQNFKIKQKEYKQKTKYEIEYYKQN
jgi:hypothetical protein